MLATTTDTDPSFPQHPLKKQTHISIQTDVKKKKFFVKSAGLKTFTAAPEKLSPEDEAETEAKEPQGEKFNNV